MLKDKKGGTGYDLAFYSKTKTRKFQWDSLVLVHEDLYRSIFWRFYHKNAKNKYVESRIYNRDEVSFRKLDLLTFTGGRQAPGFLFLDSMWTTSRACDA